MRSRTASNSACGSIARSACSSSSSRWCVVKAADESNETGVEPKQHRSVSSANRSKSVRSVLREEVQGGKGDLWRNQAFVAERRWQPWAGDGGEELGTRCKKLLLLSPWEEQEMVRLSSAKERKVNERELAACGSTKMGRHASKLLSCPPALV